MEFVLCLNRGVCRQAGAAVLEYAVQDGSGADVVWFGGRVAVVRVVEGDVRVLNRSDDDDGPVDVPERSNQVIHQRAWSQTRSRTAG